MGADAFGPPAKKDTTQDKYDWIASHHYTELGIIEDAQRAYWSVPKPPPSFNASEFNVVLHCRRTDASPHRFCHTYQVVECIHQLQNISYPGIDFHLTIYSDEEDESAFNNVTEIFSPVTIHLGNSGIKQFFHDMVTADVLVMSGSAVAWVAALIRGINDTSNMYEVWDCGTPSYPTRFN